MKWHAYALYVKKVACEIWIFEIKSLPLHRQRQKSPDGGIGRRAGLKHQWSNIHPGSTPGLGTRKRVKYL